jgi:hypothetical protein
MSPQYIEPPKGGRPFTFQGNTVFVYRNGKIWTTHKHRFLKPFIDKDGYSVFSLGKSGVKRKMFRAHWLVLYCFKRPPNIGEEGRHLNGNPSNNNIVNLDWGTHLDNEMDKEQHGRRPRAENHARAKLTNKQASEIRTAWDTNKLPKMKFYKALAKKYNVDFQVIRNVVVARNYKNV